MLIGIDIDGVLLNTSYEIIDFLNQKYNKTIRINDLTSPNWWELFKISRNEIIRDFNEFVCSSAGENQKPVFGAVDSVFKLSKKYDLISISAREEKLRKITDKLIFEIFDGNIKQTFYTGGFSNDFSKKSKGALAKKLGVEIFIDDNLHEVFDCSNYKINSYLLDYPYNQGKLSENIVRVFSWRDLISKLIN
mgnify:CR=1 FL=1